MGVSVEKYEDPRPKKIYEVYMNILKPRVWVKVFLILFGDFEQAAQGSPVPRYLPLDIRPQSGWGRPFWLEKSSKWRPILLLQMKGPRIFFSKIHVLTCLVEVWCWAAFEWCQFLGVTCKKACNSMSVLESDTPEMSANRFQYVKDSGRDVQPSVSR